MKIGIDLGGSHIAVGIINEKNEIVKKLEKDFSEEDKSNIINVIEEYLKDIIKLILNECEVDSIGIAVPRGNQKWNYSKNSKFRDCKL